MIDLYALTSPNVVKIFIMLEELELPYNTKLVDVWKGEQFTPEFTKINPNRKVPAIVDHEGPGGKPYTVIESGAILMYLAEKTGKLLPKAGTARYEVIQWFRGRFVSGRTHQTSNIGQSSLTRFRRFKKTSPCLSFEVRHSPATPKPRRRRVIRLPRRSKAKAGASSLSKPARNWAFEVGLRLRLRPRGTYVPAGRAYPPACMPYGQEAGSERCSVFDVRLPGFHEGPTTNRHEWTPTAGTIALINSCPSVFIRG